MSRVAPFGTWVSPLPAAEVAAGGLRLGAVSLDDDDIYWLEGRPREGGRYALMAGTATMQHDAMRQFEAHQAALQRLATKARTGGRRRPRSPLTYPFRSFAARDRLRP